MSHFICSRISHFSSEGDCHEQTEEEDEEDEAEKPPGSVECSFISTLSSPGLNRTVVYSLADSLDGLFSIDPVSGLVMLEKSLDRETQDSYTIQVQAADQAGQRGALSSQVAFKSHFLSYLGKQKSSKKYLLFFPSSYFFLSDESQTTDASQTNIN